MNHINNFSRITAVISVAHWCKKPTFAIQNAHVEELLAHSFWCCFAPNVWKMPLTEPFYQTIFWIISWILLFVLEYGWFLCFRENLINNVHYVSDFECWACIVRLHLLMFTLLSKSIRINMRSVSQMKNNAIHIESHIIIYGASRSCKRLADLLRHADISHQRVVNQPRLVFSSSA